MLKNNDESMGSRITIEDGFYVLRFQNDTTEVATEVREINSSFIQFHFCVKGQGDFVFNDGNYVFNVKEEHSILLYNPQRDLPIDLRLQPNTWIIGVIISIKKFHSLFSLDADHIHFLSPENSTKKYYDNGVINPSMAVVLSQILSSNIHESMKALYLKGKVYELLSLYFNKNEDTDIEQCPFLIDEDNVRKIRLAKDIILRNISEPPSLHELSEEIGLSLNKLKEGFKQLYGDTVFGYLLDHKMEEARRMLASNNYNVNEVGLKIGYSTSSHFIAAFKKKYGTTPKKYLMSLSSQ
ncbi:MAG: helix-turn-helix transcriptional regulator [Flavobacteriales bacterium]|jgi:AraC family transcriptional regulator, transcriptional activator of the genes for pyochelin and ferripyochelin receptors|nr:AraC family transcriptional regulator [Flavobacteriaceae bacterium]MDO7581339.1 AraC family transcriptional regulator [Flavobacteriaceae bacterium]MDO7591286.1 AraC family transcriptional regulator [Flavobacteriaceae bacterium]MDO7599919.1 AraC family transcriptional regulator [Flavobacteriaceae bacterium]MDO7602408.1 AraC family transcriptional regulator [Flavobacteriaceae bacterium]|tara:strand:- start:3234 stop:4121 length:888 start_codon:yes stop_codon:yes gene_type:complete